MILPSWLAWRWGSRPASSVDSGGGVPAADVPVLVADCQVCQQPVRVAGPPGFTRGHVQVEHLADGTHRWLSWHG
jgi:hypothetical protein